MSENRLADYIGHIRQAGLRGRPLPSARRRRALSAGQVAALRHVISVSDIGEQTGPELPNSAPLFVPLVPHRCPGIAWDELGLGHLKSTYDGETFLDVFGHPGTSNWPARRDSNPRHPT